MSEFLAQILGTYTPVTYAVTNVIDGETVTDIVVASGLAGVDWHYVISGLCFAVVLYSVLRILGGVIKGD